MAKFDRVDRLMEQAAAPQAPSRTEVLPKESAPPAALESAAGAPGQVGRQLLGNLDPLMPVLGRVLQAFPHSGIQAVGRGVQAAERLLPLFRMFAGSAARAAEAPQPPALPGAGAEKQTALEGEVKDLRERLQAQENQLRRTREALERTVAEQGALAHLAHRLQERSRLLTAALLVLLVLVISQVVLLVVALHR